MSDTAEDSVVPDYDHEALWTFLQPASGRAGPQKWRWAGKARRHKHVDDAFTSEESKYVYVTADPLNALIGRYEDALPDRLDSRPARRRNETVTGYYLVPPVEDFSWPYNAPHRHGLHEDSGEPFATAEEDKEPTIRVSALLKKGAALAAIIFIASIVYWLWTGTVIVNPFLAILLIIGLPFVYLMGAYIEKGDIT